MELKMIKVYEIPADFETLPASELVAAYNDMAVQIDVREVKKFSDKETAIKRVREMRIICINRNEEEEHKMTESAKAATKVKVAKEPKAPKAPKAESTGVRGRKSEFSGLQLYASKETNTRKVGSFGHASMEIIFANPGISYEEFISKGGRGNDLKWDVEHGNAKAETLLSEILSEAA
jgi:hypothetical protein